MYVEETTPGKFAIQDVTTSELEIIQEALISFEVHRLPNVDDFQVEKGKCTEMAAKIDLELINSKS